MIRIGTGGVPFSAKERSSISGIKRISELKLSAMEMEFVRGVKMSVEVAKEVGAVAKQLDVALSAHAPYYINLLSEKKAVVIASHRMILETQERTAAAGGIVTAIHSGYYGKLPPEKATEQMIIEYEKIARVVRAKGWDSARIGLEVTAKKAAWGSVEELVEVCRAVPECVPVIDWAHMWVRTGGQLDASAVLDKLRHWKHLHFHFAGARKTQTGWADIHTPIGNNPPYGPIVHEVLKRKLDCTFISETPDLELGALSLKRLLEKSGHRF